MQQYDVTHGDLNPTILYACKRTSKENGVYHDHDYTELTYILSGRCKYLVNGVEHVLEAGDVLMCNKGVKHQYVLIGPSEPAVEFFTGFTDFHFRNMPPNSILFREGAHILHTSSDLRQELNQCCYAMDAENDGCKSGKYFMLKAYLIRMLLLIVRETTGESDVNPNGYIFSSSNKSYVVRKIITYMNENYAHKISLDQIAHNMYLSPVYISKIFKEETGESPINYVIKIRLERAKELLKNEGGQSIKNIANRVGYDDVYYFSKLFKKYYGMSPLHYKKSITS